MPEVNPRYAPLIGKPLSTVAVIDDNNRLQFTLADGRTITYWAEGDCCSWSWIEHLTVPQDLSGAVVSEVNESDVVEEKSDEHDCLQVYHTAFVTAAGEIVVEYRNSSNGYYGGQLEGPVERWAVKEKFDAEDARRERQYAQWRAYLGRP